MNKFNNFFPPRKGLWIIIAIIMSIIITYQAILTICVPLRINIFILFIELLFFFYVIFRIIWCN